MSLVENVLSVLLNKTFPSLAELGARCSSMVRAFAHGAMGHQIDPSCAPIELFLILASAT